MIINSIVMKTKFDGKTIKIPKEQGKIKNYLLALDEEQHRKLKILALEQDTTIRELILKALKISI